MNILALATVAALSADSGALEPPPAAHPVALEVTPLGLFVGHYGAQLEIVPLAHHGIVLSGFYMGTSTSVPAADPKAPPTTHDWHGFGGELGYRYFVTEQGPGGLYFGPSLLVGSYRGPGVDFRNLGGAVDVGYQAVIEHVLIGLSAGVQYVHVDKEIPADGDPSADVHTQSVVRPRVAVTFGWAF